MFTDRYGRNKCAALTGVIAPALMLLASASPALAQQGGNGEKAASDNGPQDNAIIVEGMKKSELKKAIGGYVRTLTEMSPNSPLARYQPDFYCPVVLGLDNASNEKIAERMRRVAEAAGVRPAKVGCTASALVFLVNDKSSFLKEFKKQQPIYFKDPKGDLWSPPSEDGPVMSWQLTQEMTPEGAPISQDETGVRIVSSPTGGSRLLSMVTMAVAMSVVIIERNALVGLSTTQIADYALMRSLTDSGPKNLKDAEQFSILGVVDAPMDSATHASLTAWDLAYIEGRYKNDARTYGPRQGAVIRENIERAVADKNEG